MALPNYKDIVELLKKGATIEAQEKIMELREAALELQEENINLKNQVIELQGKVRKLESFEGEPCPKCRKPAWVVESSKPDPQFGDLGGIRREYRCTECGFTESQLVTPK
ncbi:hypothetical protein [Thioalbus denitrificans]|uniref:hypothetical protein n=1 Tax=Thioalbus denitrificans TaxID=547122 RepID=UPI000DF1948D|nr:hypothetical protein [Thioalbus denitrificans]